MHYSKYAGAAVGAMLFFSSVLPASAAGLTSAQISAIIGLLQSFGADQSVIDNVQANLTGKAVANSIRVTAPNGGEQWQEGVMNSVTWDPYDPNSGINPSSDVTAYLEKQDYDGHFVTVGNVEESGKASIHWLTGSLNAGPSNNLVPTGNSYYIRVVNNKTGASDRSDAAFTLTLPPVSMKVNGSHGPLTLGDNTQVTVSWSSTGTTGCAIYALRQHQGDTVVPEINNLPTSGYQSGYTIVDSSYGGYVSVSCHTSDGTTYSDFVSINPAASAPKLSILSPNGGEQIQGPFNIKWTQRGLSTISIALYKNDKWYAWIDKDVSSDKSADATYSYAWDGRIAGVDTNAGNIYKIYITGQQADGTGYLDDKSNTPFGFSSSVVTASLDSSLSLVAGGSQVITGTAAGVGKVYLAFHDGPGNYGPTAVALNYGIVNQNGTWALNLVYDSQKNPGGYSQGLMAGTYTVIILSADQQTFGKELGQGTLVVSNTPPPPKLSTSLIVTDDPNSNGYSIVTGGSTGVELGRVRFSATNEAIDLRQLALRASSASPSDLVGRQVTLWDATTGTQVGVAVFPTGFTATSSAIASGAFRIPMNGSRTLIIKGDIASLGQMGPITVSGDLLQVNFDSNNVTRTYGTFGVGVSSASNIQPTGNTSVAGVRIFKSYPTVAFVDIPTSKILTPGPHKVIYRFSVMASPSGDIDTAAILKFNVGSSNVSLSDYTLHEYTDANYSILDTTQMSPNGLAGVVEGSTVGFYKVANSVGTHIQIPAGATRYFELQATVSGVSVNSLVSIKLLGDSTYAGVTSYSDQKQKGSNFVWSPNTLTLSQESALDWANGYSVRGLGSSLTAQTLTGEGPLPPISTPTLTIISPTSATGVGSGQKTTISWKADNAPAGSVVMMQIARTDHGSKTAGMPPDGISTDDMTLPTTGSYTWDPNAKYCRPFGTDTAGCYAYVEKGDYTAQLWLRDGAKGQTDLAPSVSSPIITVSSDRASRDLERKANLDKVATVLGIYKEKKGTYPLSDGWVSSRQSGNALTSTLGSSDTPVDNAPGSCLGGVGDNTSSARAYWYISLSGGNGYKLTACSENIVPASDPYYDAVRPGYVLAKCAGTSACATVATTKPSSQVATITHTLSQGWTGGEVTALQKALTALGVYSGEITGYFGSLTQAAVSELQTKNNVAAVGVVGPKTRSLLQQLLGR